MTVVTQQQAKCLLYAAGIFVCYFYYGILQETITKGKYVGADGKPEKFTYTITLVFIQCVLNASFAALAKRIFDKGGEDATSYTLYALCSISYLGAMLASNLALQWVAYPTQVLGKSAKPIPVMIMGVIFARKRYPLLKYLFVLCISTGVALFVYKDSKSTGIDADKPVGLGEFLLVVSLALDGATGASQSRMRCDYKTSAGSMMLNMNLWSILWLTLALCTGEALAFIQFAQLNPIVLWNMVKFGLASALGQHFIFLVVANFGPLTCSIVTTTRKFFTILASVLLFGNTMSSRQWTGTALVFLGLGLDMLFGKETKPAVDPEALKISAKTKGVEHTQ